MGRGRRKMITSHVTELPSSTAFLDALATQLKIGRSSTYRRAVQRTLEAVKRNFESGQYQSTTEAELMLRKLLDREEQASAS